MNIAAYIFLGFFVLSLAGSFAIPVKLVKNIFTCLILPFLCGITISILIMHLPDSYHSIVLLAGSFLVLSIAVILIILNLNKFFIYSGYLIGTLGLYPQIHFYQSIFNISHVPVFFIIFLISLLVILLTLLIIFSKKLSLIEYGFLGLSYFFCSFYIIVGLTNLFFIPGLASALLFTATLLLFLDLCFWMLNKKSLTIKASPIICKGVFFLSQTLICVSTILMIGSF